jgi:hypothetical protein
MVWIQIRQQLFFIIFNHPSKSLQKPRFGLMIDNLLVGHDVHLILILILIVIQISISAKNNPMIEIIDMFESIFIQSILLVYEVKFNFFCPKSGTMN